MPGTLCLVGGWTQAPPGVFAKDKTHAHAHTCEACCKICNIKSWKQPTHPLAACAPYEMQLRNKKEPSKGTKTTKGEWSSPSRELHAPWFPYMTSDIQQTAQIGGMGQQLCSFEGQFCPAFVMVVVMQVPSTYTCETFMTLYQKMANFICKFKNKILKVFTMKK